MFLHKHLTAVQVYRRSSNYNICVFSTLQNPYDHKVLQHQLLSRSPLTRNNINCRNLISVMLIHARCREGRRRRFNDIVNTYRLTGYYYYFFFYLYHYCSLYRVSARDTIQILQLVSEFRLLDKNVIIGTLLWI